VAVPYKVKKTGRWAAQVREANGHKRQVGTCATRREAVELERQYYRQQPSSARTVQEWWEVWLADPTWRESTRAHNRERTKMFVLHFGKRRLTSINRTDARDHIARHPSSHNALSAMFGAARYVDDEHGHALLINNPFSRLVKRTVRRRDLQSEWLVEADVLALEEAAVNVYPGEFGRTMAGMVRFAAETLVRPGELFVITDPDLLLDTGRLVVARAADSKTRRVTLPKNGQAREIVLSARAAEAAARAQRHPGTDRVFSTPTGKQFWLSSFLYYWKDVRAAAGRPEMDFYELRHYGVTRLLEAGLSERDVALQAGHTDGGELVRKVYGHPSDRRSLGRVRDMLDGRGEEAA
jgi:integrase